MCTGADVCTFVLLETEASGNGFILNVVVVFLLEISLTHILSATRLSHILPS